MRRTAFSVVVGSLAAVRLMAISLPPRVVHIALESAPIAIAVNPSTGELLALESEGRLTIIDEVTRRSSVAAVPSGAIGLTVDSETDRVYVASGTYFPGGAGGALTVVEPATGRTESAAACCVGSPTANSSTHKVYVTNPFFAYHSGVGFHSIGVFDGDTLASHGVLIGGSRSVVIAMDELHDRIYVATLGDLMYSAPTLTIIDGATEQSLDVAVDCPQFFPSDTGTSNVAVDPGLNQAWVLCSGDPRILQVSPDGRMIVAYALPSAPTFLVADGTSHKAYVAFDGRASVIEIDPDLRVVHEIAISEPASGLAVNPQTHTIYASHAAAGTVTLIDGQSLETIDVEVGTGAGNMVVDTTRDITWVATEAGLSGFFSADSPCARCTRVVHRPVD